jgi:N-acyl-D-aspartate/D-glutamate deacylase
MTGLVRHGLEAGAIGFSTSRVAHQKGEFGEPIPSYVAAEGELFTLVDVLREMDRGIIGINPRTKALDFVQEDRDQLFRLAQSTGRVVNWNEFNQRPQYPGQWRSLLDFMEGAQRNGARVYAVMRTQPMDFHFNLQGSQRFIKSDLWRDFMGLPAEQKMAWLGDGIRRAALAQALRDAPDDGRLRSERIGVTVASLEKNQGMNGRLLTDIAAEMRGDPAQVFVDLALEEGLETEFGLLGVSNDDDRAVEAMLRSPATITGISDAGAHLHTLCGVDYPTYLLSRWVRQKQAFSLEEAVKTLTSVPAGLAGLQGRGVVRPGASADLCIFDPETVAPAPLEVWHDLPGGESRHVKRAAGMHWVIVNGEVLLQQGEPSGASPGQVLTG